jgi:hypothetical protein
MSNVDVWVVGLCRLRFSRVQPAAGGIAMSAVQRRSKRKVHIVAVIAQGLKSYRHLVFLFFFFVKKKTTTDDDKIFFFIKKSIII